MPGTVSVCCKMPNGLILRVYEMEKAYEDVMGGGTRETLRARLLDGEVVLRGTATPFGQPPKFLTPGGYAITPNVDADFFALWLEQNKNSDLVKQRVVFAHQKAESAHALAKENADVKTGLEPVDPANPRARLGNFSSKISLEVSNR